MIDPVEELREEIKTLDEEIKTLDDAMAWMETAYQRLKGYEEALEFYAGTNIGATAQSVLAKHQEGER